MLKWRDEGEEPALHNEDYGRLLLSASISLSLAMADDCTHLPEELATITPLSDGCEQCLESGSTWVHLRVCASCGQVGCCDQSPNRHSRAHFDARPDHPLMRSLEPGEAWWYCWVDDFGFEIAGEGPLR